MDEDATYFFLTTGGVGFTPDGTLLEGAVPCTPEQYQNPNKYFIDYSTNPPSIAPVTEATSLQLAQAAQIMKLSQVCQNVIYSGYKSSGLGKPYLYPAKPTDQSNMISSLMACVGSVLFDTDPWSANTPVVEGQLVWVNKQLYSVSQNGVTGTQAPLWPMQVGETVTDGTAQWQLWTTPFWCADLSIEPYDWQFRPHSLRELWQVGKDAKVVILSNMGVNTLLAARVMMAKTIEEVQAVTWPEAP